MDKFEVIKKEHIKRLLEVYKSFKTTKEVPIPKDPFLKIIGQENAIKIARICAKQRRHLLLVGPPGTGKSMIGRAIASILPKPQTQISVMHNPERPERPLLKIERREEIEKMRSEQQPIGKLIWPEEAPISVAEELGYRCSKCGEISSPNLDFCPSCGAKKFPFLQNPFDDLLLGYSRMGKKKMVKTKRTFPDGRVEVVIYEAFGNKIRVLTESEIKKLRKMGKEAKKVIVPLDRETFVQASGASETELLGDVQHDPYGGHPEIGIPPYLRVVPGAVHEAHEGVLYIDELTHLNYQLQKSILTSMQDKKFPITGRNTTSTGAAVRVDDVPSDFVLVASVNFQDINNILPPLRSRISGEGYEVLVEVTMPDNKENRSLLMQFVAQEIIKDGKIPHATRRAVMRIIEEAKNIAKKVDEKTNALTVRLRKLAGIVKLAGDLAKLEESEYIEEKHVKEALKNALSIEEQIQKRYDNWWKAALSDNYIKKAKTSDAI